MFVSHKQNRLSMADLEENVENFEFSVCDHSFVHCDRNFSTVKRKIRRKERTYTPEKYNEMIRIVKNTCYSVTNILSENVLNFKN